MSLIKSIKQQLGIGNTASEQHFWDGSVPNQLSLKRGTPEAPGAELIKALNGVLSFPNQGQSLTVNGFLDLPGGLTIQWGQVDITGGGDVVFSFAKPFNGIPINIIGSAYQNDLGTQATVVSFRGFSASGAVAQLRRITSGGTIDIPASTVFYIALGNF